MADTRWLLVRYYAYRVTGSAGFYLPISIYYLQDQGFSLGFVGLTQAVFLVAMVVMEIPTGYVGDRLGRRRTLAVGNALRASAMVGYAVASARPTFLLVQVVWATGWTLRSGTQDAWLYELLASRYDESEYARVDGRGAALLLGSSAVAALSSGILYSVATWIPFLVNATLAAAGIPILLSFPDVGDDDPDGGSTRLSVLDAVTVLRAQVARPEVRWLVAYAALFNGLFSITRTFEQPALEAVGVPVAAFGVLYAGFKLVSAGAASSSGYLEDRLGARGVFLALVPLYAVSYAAIAAWPLLVVPAIVVNRSIRVLTRPIRNQYLNDRLADVGRATVLSGASMALSLSAGAANVAGGLIAGTYGPLGFLPWAGVAVAAVGGILWVAVSPVADEVAGEDPTLTTAD